MRTNDPPNPPSAAGHDRHLSRQRALSVRCTHRLNPRSALLSISMGYAPSRMGYAPSASATGPTLIRR